MSEDSELKLETLERWALSRARQDLAPDVERIARIEAGLGAQLGLIPTSGYAPSTDAAPERIVESVPVAEKTSRSSFARAFSGPVRLPIVTGLGGALLGLILGMKLAEPPPTRRSETSGAFAEDQRKRPADEEGAKMPPIIVSPPAEQAMPSDAKAPSRTMRRDPAKSIDKAPTAPEPLYQELSYLRRAQQAMKEGSFGQALGLMVELRSLSPQGSLLSEREVTEVLALCALGRSAEAQVVATRLKERDRKLAYGNRLKSSCVSEEVRRPSDE